jgi:putative transposase
MLFMGIHAHFRAAVFGPWFTTGHRRAKIIPIVAFYCQARSRASFVSTTSMSRNYYSEINLHLTWHCKDSAPLLTPSVEPLAHREIRHKIINTPGVFVHEIGGTENHMHVAVTIPPTLTISEFVGQVKGASSHEVNELMRLRGKVLQWQVGYGVVSFGTRELPWVVDYIRKQREHHAAGRIFDRLERITELEEEPGKPG